MLTIKTKLKKNTILIVTALFLVLSCSNSDDEPEFDPNNWCGEITDITTGNPTAFCPSGARITVLINNDIVRSICFDEEEEADGLEVGNVYCYNCPTCD